MSRYHCQHLNDFSNTKLLLGMMTNAELLLDMMTQPTFVSIPICDGAVLGGGCEVAVTRLTSTLLCSSCLVHALMTPTARLNITSKVLASLACWEGILASICITGNISVDHVMVVPCTYSKHQQIRQPTVQPSIMWQATDNKSLEKRQSSIWMHLSCLHFQ